MKTLPEEKREIADLAKTILGDATEMPSIEEVEMLIPLLSGALIAWAESDGQDGPWASLIRALAPERDAVLRVVLIAARSIKANEAVWNPPAAGDDP